MRIYYYKVTSRCYFYEYNLSNRKVSTRFVVDGVQGVIFLEELGTFYEGSDNNLHGPYTEEEAHHRGLQEAANLKLNLVILNGEFAAGPDVYMKCITLQEYVELPD